jgi:hypothetical protein
MKEEEKIAEEFSKLLRELPEKQFWEWVSSWKDIGSIMEQAEEWSIGTKRADLPKLRKLMKESKA